MSVLDSTKAHQRFFEEIAAIPHGSENEKALSEYIIGIAKAKGLDYFTDSLFNVVVKKPASKGYENAPSVMLEAHMDMVCVKTPDSKHDFMKDPLKLYVDSQNRVRAEGTTLGADDIYGVSYLLAIMTEDCPHPPLELVFTSQEENGCWGAKALDCSRLVSRRMIGLDVMGSMNESECVVSCFSSDLMTASKKYNVFENKSSAVKVTVSGIQPIRQGAETHPELFNSIKIMARLLKSAQESGIAFELSELEGGEAENYAPVSTSAVICCSDKERLGKVFEAELNSVKAELDDGKQDIKLEFSDVCANNRISAEDTCDLMDFIFLMPSNTFSVSVTDASEMTSTNTVGVVALKNGEFKLVMSDRARNTGFKKGILRRVRSLCAFAGMELRVESRYESWEYDPDSYMRALTGKLMKDYYGTEMNETVCPGGLECCDFIPKMPGLDIVMFAPIGGECHSANEWLDLDSFDRVYDFLKILLKNLDK